MPRWRRVVSGPSKPRILLHHGPGETHPVRRLAEQVRSLSTQPWTRSSCPGWAITKTGRGREPIGRGVYPRRRPRDPAHTAGILRAWMKVAFIGTHGVGKTTLCYEIGRAHV